MTTSSGFCPDCGLQLWSQWGFCPRCGRNLEDLHLSLWQNQSSQLAQPVTIRSPTADEALRLMSEGFAAEAEMRLEASLHESPADVELRLILAEVLFQRYAIQEAGGLLDEALALAPQEFAVRLRRGEYLARLGRYTEALTDLSAARRLPAPSFPAMLYGQELHRWVADRARTSFIRETALPKAPQWLSHIGARLRRALRTSTGSARSASRKGGEGHASADPVHRHAGPDAHAGLPAIRRGAEAGQGDQGG